MDVNEFREAGKQMIDFVADYLENIRARPVLPDVEPGYLPRALPREAPQEGQPWSEIFPDIERYIMPGMTHWHSPNFFAYFPTSNSYPAIVADILSGALACIGFSWIASPACTELEMVVMDWLAKMLKLPEEFLFEAGGKGGGVIHGTASEATLVALLAARSRTLKRMFGDEKESDEAHDFSFLSKLVAYTSEEAHSSVERAGLLGAVKIRPLEPDENLSLRGSSLTAAIKEDVENGLIPFLVVATLGTTNSLAFDSLEELGPICQANGIWLHVDAAYAGASFICPEFRPLLNGIEYADSFNFNPHKWLLVNFDCSTFWIKNSDYLVQAFNVNPLYLQHEHQGEVPDFRHWQIPLGRRFRSLKMWFVFRSYGVNGLQSHIRKQVDLAKRFETLVRSHDKFEITFPVTLGLVCFRVKASDALNERLVKALNAERKIHLTPCRIKGRYTLRFAICSRWTEEGDVLRGWEIIKRHANQLLDEAHL